MEQPRVPGGHQPGPGDHRAESLVLELKKMGKCLPLPGRALTLERHHESPKATAFSPCTLAVGVRLAGNTDLQASPVAVASFDHGLRFFRTIFRTRHGIASAMNVKSTEPASKVLPPDSDRMCKPIASYGLHAKLASVESFSRSQGGPEPIKPGTNDAA